MFERVNQRLTLQPLFLNSTAIFLSPENTKNHCTILEGNSATGEEKGLFQKMSNFTLLSLRVDVSRYIKNKNNPEIRLQNRFKVLISQSYTWILF